MYDPIKRALWDNSLKNIKVLTNDDTGLIIHLHYNSPMFLVSERDLVDKYMNFMQDGVFYSLSSSVDNTILTEFKDVIRCSNYINLFTLYEDTDYFYFINFNQADVKVIIKIT
jgi:hypothetical protein